MNCSFRVLGRRFPLIGWRFRWFALVFGRARTSTWRKTASLRQRRRAVVKQVDPRPDAHRRRMSLRTSPARCGARGPATKSSVRASSGGAPATSLQVVTQERLVRTRHPRKRRRSPAQALEANCREFIGITRCRTRGAARSALGGRPRASWQTASGGLSWLRGSTASTLIATARSREAIARTGIRGHVHCEASQRMVRGDLGGANSLHT